MKGKGKMKVDQWIKLCLIAVIIVVGSALICGLYWLYQWGKQVNADTYRIEIPAAFDSYLEEMEQDMDILLADGCMLEEKSYDVKKELFSVLSDFEKNTKQFAMIFQYIDDWDTLQEYSGAPINCTQITIPKGAGYSGMQMWSEKDLLSAGDVLDVLELDQLKKILSLNLYLWQEEYRLNCGKTMNSQKYVFMFGDKVLVYSFTVEGKYWQKGEYQVYIANIQKKY